MPLTQAADRLMHTLPREIRRSGTYTVGGPHRPPQQAPPQRQPLREPHRPSPLGKRAHYRLTRGGLQRHRILHLPGLPVRLPAPHQHTKSVLVAEHPGRKPNDPASVGLDLRRPGNLPTNCTIEEWEAAVSVELDDGKVSGPTLDFLRGPLIGSAQADTLTATARASSSPAAAAATSSSETPA